MMAPERPSSSAPMIAKTKIRPKTGHGTGTVMSESNNSKRSQNSTLDKKTNGLPAPRLLDYKSAGAYLSLSYWSLRELVLNGEIPHLKFGKKVLIDRIDLDDWIETRKEIGVF